MFIEKNISFLILEKSVKKVLHSLKLCFIIMCYESDNKIIAYGCFMVANCDQKLERSLVLKHGL